MKENSYELYIPGKTENLQKIGDFITDIAKKNGVPEEQLEDLVIATDEAATNIILHAYHHKPDAYIRLRAIIKKDRIVISLFDNGALYWAEFRPAESGRRGAVSHKKIYGQSRILFQE